MSPLGYRLRRMFSFSLVEVSLIDERTIAGLGYRAATSA
jgi:hypothetical protein